MVKKAGEQEMKGKDALVVSLSRVVWAGCWYLNVNEGTDWRAHLKAPYFDRRLADLRELLLDSDCKPALEGIPVLRLATGVAEELHAGGWLPTAAFGDSERKSAQRAPLFERGLARQTPHLVRLLVERPVICSTVEVSAPPVEAAQSYVSS